jgi:hypothetical protein
MFRTQYDLDEHVEQEHPEPEWRCDACDKQFMNENNLRMVSIVSIRLSEGLRAFRPLASLKLKDERMKAN